MIQQNQADQYLILEAQQALTKLKQSVHSPDWTQFSDQPCKMYKSYVGNRLLSKGQMVIKLGMKEIVEELVKEDVMKKLNFQLKQIVLLREFRVGEKQARVNYMRFKGIWPVQDRDFVNVSIKQEQQNTCYIASIESQYPYPKINKVTRAICHIAGYILQKIDSSSTRVIYISDVDVLGSIPQIFKNKLSEWQAAMPKQVEKILVGKSDKEEDQQEDEIEVEAEEEIYDIDQIE